ncbi:Chalcone--flavonone isomerase [Hibiscus syriacus]|uniref:Chalcone-flavonone isomerase family protein n=1 Tax=Hibiscus syriacus TaxID=106335 RepID=A0A6A3B727_HIBSY|nr:Chalcone--flavonone isomerase [Hibiscus syriacus]
MSTSPSITQIEVENVTFAPSVKPPGSTNNLFLGGAGLDIEGKFIKVTAIGVYLEDKAVKCLAAKWKGKNAEELAESVEFFRDIVTDRANTACPALFLSYPNPNVLIGVSKDMSVPEAGKAVIENKY